MAISFSTTKGVASTVVHRLVERGLLEYDERVAAYWPEFGTGGKERVTVRELLTHRAGLSSVRAVADRAEDLLDHLAMEDELAARSVHAPTTRSAYHAITYGWLIAGLCRRVTDGVGLAELARVEVTEPLGIDGLQIGVPEDAREFVAEPVGSALRQLGSSADATQRLWSRYTASRTTIDALHVPGFHRLFEGDEPPIWTTEMPAVNGAISARALAQMYEPLANAGRAGEVQYLQPESVEHLGRVQVRTRDAVLGIPMRWRLGYHQAFGAGRGSSRAFGHYGSGGWADPETGLSAGFVTNRIGSLTTPLGDLNLFRLNRIVRRCAMSVT